MGLSVSLSNALSGMNTTQKGLEVLSRNVANAGTPGYHRQSVNLSDQLGVRSAYAHLAGVNRAFSSALQRQQTNDISTAGFTDVRAEFMQRVQTYLGMPGDATSLSDLFGEFESALQEMATSPDDYTTRASVVTTAQALATTLNRLTTETQAMRQEAESQIANHVTDLNQMLSGLEQINNSLISQGGDDLSRAALLDERDRLVSQIAEIVDVRVEYRNDDTIALMTQSGLGLLDKGATLFEFQSAGSLSANARFSIFDSQNGVGSLYATTPSGLRIDVVEQDVVNSGRIGALLDLRDSTLNELQDQLDEIASALAQVFSTVETAGTAVSGPPDGFSIDTASMVSGNDFSVSYTINGTTQNVRVVRVDDPTKLPMDKVSANGERIIGLDFSAGTASVASALNTALGPNITFSNPSGSVLQVVDDGVGNVSNITSMSMRTTATATQGGTSAMPLFVDTSGAAYTDALDGDGQKRGFAGRISINPAIVSNNSLLVQANAGDSLGNADRANFFLDQLQNMRFAGTTKTSEKTGFFSLNGSVQDLIGQTLNFQGKVVNLADSQKQQAELTLEATNQRMDAEYGVDIDEEMARLMELQNAYAASARVVSTVQELLNALMQI